MQRLTVGFVVSVLSVSFAAADSEPCWATTAAELDTGETPEGRFYVDVFWCLPLINAGCARDLAVSLWHYEESNGIEGLQRHDVERNDVGDCVGTSGDAFIERYP